VLILLFQNWTSDWAFPRSFLCDVGIEYTKSHMALERSDDSLTDRKNLLVDTLNAFSSPSSQSAGLYSTEATRQPQSASPLQQPSSSSSSCGVVTLTPASTTSPRQYIVEWGAAAEELYSPNALAGSIPPLQSQVEKALAEKLALEYRDPSKSGSDKSPPFQIVFGKNNHSSRLATITTTCVDPRENSNPVFPPYFARQGATHF
jgi:hypothetical protein